MGDSSEFESVRDDQELNLSRLQRKTEKLKKELAEQEALEKSSKEQAKQSAKDLAKAAKSSSEIVTMFMEEFEKLSKASVGIKADVATAQGELVDESGVFDMQKKHCR